MSEHKNADGQAGQEPVAWTTVLALNCRAESFAFEVCPTNIWGKNGVPLYTHPAPSQEGHAAGPACPAPDEALIEEIVNKYITQGYRCAVEGAIREYIRRSAGKEKL